MVDAANKEIFLAPSKVAPAITVEQVTILNFLPVPAGLINGIIDLVTPGLTDILSTVRLPLPIPADLPVQLKDISTVGVNNDHLSLSLDADLFALAELLIPPATSTVAQ